MSLRTTMASLGAGKVLHRGDALRGGLPVSYGRFVGRRTPLTELSHRLAEADGRILTVVGAPGVGKSRLALEAVRKVRLDASGGSAVEVHWVDLSTLKDESDIVTFLETIVGSDGETSMALSTRAGAAQSSAPLIVLDNAENHGDALRRLLPVLSHQRTHRFLLTSRRPLGLASEALYELPPLSLVPESGEGTPLSEAVALFVDRANRRRFLVDPFKNINLLNEIVTCLDGLPLALELAASRCEVLSLEQLYRRLKADLLGIVVSLGATSRHRSLVKAIESSWQQMGEEERRALAQCSVFEGDFTVEAAEGVLSLEAAKNGYSILDMIQRLRELCLIVPSEGIGPSPDRRLRLLNSIRTFATEELVKMGESAAVRTRHLRWYAHRAKGHRNGRYGHNDGAVRTWFRAEQNNLRAAYDWACIALEAGDVGEADALEVGLPLWSLQYAPPRNLDDALSRKALVEAVATDNPAFAVDALALLLDGFMGGECQIAVDAIEWGLSLVDSDALAKGRLLTHAVSFHLATGRNDLAEATCAQARRELGEEIPPVLMSALQSVEALTAASLGQFDRALKNVATARMFARRIGAHGDLIRMVGLLAEIHAERGEVATATYYIREYRTLCQQLSRPGLECRGMFLEALLELEAGNLKKAEAVVLELLDWAHQLQEWPILAHAYSALGLIKYEVGDLSAAESFLKLALEQSEKCGGQSQLAGACLNLATVQADLDRMAVSRSLFNRVRELMVDYPNQVDERLYGLREAHHLLAQARQVGPRSEEFIGFVHEVKSRLNRCVSPENARRGHRLGQSMTLRRAIRHCEASLKETLARHSNQVGGGADLSLNIEHIVMGRDGQRFSIPGHPPVDLKGKRTLTLLLARLVEAYIHAPGEALSVDDMLKAGWPGERVLADSGRSRVRVAVFHLRDLGLRDLLLTHGGGYLLDPEAKIDIRNS